MSDYLSRNTRAPVANEDTRGARPAGGFVQLPSGRDLIGGGKPGQFFPSCSGLTTDTTNFKGLFDGHKKRQTNAGISRVRGSDR
jgi:hypothetical protein